MSVSLLASFFVLAVPLAAQTGWKLAWSDEFDGPSGAAPNPAKWTFDVGGGGWGNREIEVYTDSRENSRLDGQGHLLVRALKSASGGYTSARLKTQGLFATEHGRLEARIKLPFGQGIWPAFWMLGSNIGKVDWPDCGEVDIMENIGRQPLLNYGTIHGPGYAGAGVSASYELPDHKPYHDAFHIFAIEWSRDRLVFFVDGIAYQTVTPASLPPGGTWAFEHPFFFLLNVAVGGDWPGNPDQTTVFPQEMVVDYVRVFKAE